MGFLIQIDKVKGKEAEGRVVAEVSRKKLLEEAETQPLQTYLNSRQVILLGWVTLRPIFNVFRREARIERGGKLQVLWWRQAAA